MPQRWRSVGNTVLGLIGPRFEPQTSHSGDERVTAQPNGQPTQHKPIQSIIHRQSLTVKLTSRLVQVQTWPKPENISSNPITNSKPKSRPKKPES